MASKHLDVRWVQVRAKVKPRLIAALPAPCPRCGGVMTRDMKLDLGHISRAAHVAFHPGNLRLEHRSCNRRDGQRITSAKRRAKTTGERMPGW